MKNIGFLSIVLWFSCFVGGCTYTKKESTIVLTDLAKGEALFKASNCISCHSITGENMYGPILNAILNTKVEVIRNEQSYWVTIDREYLIRSIENPEYEKPIDFQTRKMPKPDLSKNDIELITDYLISINSIE